MSVDTNLHRTFDCQLSPAALQIIDWAPVTTVARAVLPSTPTSKSYTFVDDASANAKMVAASYVQQEKARREAAEAATGGGGTSLPPVAGPATSESPAAANAPLPPMSSMPLPSSVSAGGMDAPGMNDASTATLTDSSAAACFQGVEDVSPVPQRQASASDNWSAAAAPLGNGDGGNATSTHVSSGSSGANVGRSGAATCGASLAGEGAALMGHGDVAANARTRASTAADTAGYTPNGTPPSTHSPPPLVKSVYHMKAAGTMFGYDCVYQKDSFGILAGLFTGVGYHQVNTSYRSSVFKREERSGASSSASLTLTGNTPAPTATSSSDAVRGTNLKHPADGTSDRETANTEPLGFHAASPPASPALHSGATNTTTAAVGNATDRGPRKRASLFGSSVAHERKGWFQLSNVLQCFWYWGVRQWTGVVNVRLIPLPTGELNVPGCEVVLRTPMTEHSLLVDDPVVYAHSFVVLLSRRPRAAEEAMTPPRLARAEPDSQAAGTALHPVTLAAAADAVKIVKRHNNSGNEEHSAAAHALSDSKQQSSSAEQRVDVLSSSSSSLFNRPASSSTHHQPHHSHHGKVTSNASTSTSLVRGAANEHDNPRAASITETAQETRSWWYWYRRCVLDTSDEWMVNRSASAVAAAAATHAQAPWWTPRHVKMGVGLSYRYRKPRGINVYWGWAAQLGRGTFLSSHVDVLRRMSCAVSSSFGFLDFSVRLRVNLVTLHQTALDAGVCWRPLPLVPELAVRAATTASGTTLGVEVADVAPVLYDPLMQRLSAYRAGRRDASASEKAVPESARDGGNVSPPDGTASTSAAVASRMDVDATLRKAPTSDHIGTEAQPSDLPNAASAAQKNVDRNREDLVGLLPVTWHYIRGFGSTITRAYGGVVGAVADTWSSRNSTPPPPPSPAASATLGSAEKRREMNVSPGGTPSPALPVSPPPFTGVSAPAQMPPPSGGTKFLAVALPINRARLRSLRQAWDTVADLGWLENMLRTSHINVSAGITSEPHKGNRDWSFFVILCEK